MSLRRLGGAVPAAGLRGAEGLGGPAPWLRFRGRLGWVRDGVGGGWGGVGGWVGGAGEWV